jgi:hypothetical protein
VASFAVSVFAIERGETLPHLVKEFIQPFSHLCLSVEGCPLLYRFFASLLVESAWNLSRATSCGFRLKASEVSRSE